MPDNSGFNRMALPAASSAYSPSPALRAPSAAHGCANAAGQGCAGAAPQGEGRKAPIRLKVRALRDRFAAVLHETHRAERTDRRARSGAFKTHAQMDAAADNDPLVGEFVVRHCANSLSFGD
jgi:hypothetical protein